MERMGNPALAPREHYTYRHYRTWPDSERWELIDGHAWSMCAAPAPRHQILLGKLHLELGSLLKGKPCMVFLAPFDVLFPQGDEEDDEVDTVVQPDISVYCDRSRITKRGGRGAPDLAIEILSPSTSRKDQNEKHRLYERAGVREYWVIDPGAASVWRYRRLPDDRFDEGELRQPYFEYGPIDSAVVPGFTIRPEELFADLD
ncbi:MAG: Uma2 family endonuclease [Spirochaetaceae bacterium]|nr:Uma2 family endonuclease [Spirochaetaceae bacterium]